MDHVFSEFGVEHEDNGPHSLVLQPGDHMSCTEFPGLPEGGLTVTFDRTQALGRDDMLDDRPQVGPDRVERELALGDAGRGERAVDVALEFPLFGRERFTA